MTYDWILYAILFLALWSAVIGGVFSAFSEFIMKALLRAHPSTGIEAMHQINITVIPSQFVAGLILIPLLSIGLAFFALGSISGLPLLAIIMAAVILVPSVLLMTMFGNVPMNNRLAGLGNNIDEAIAYWDVYGRRWTQLNHFRTFGSIMAAVLYVVAAVSLMHTGQI